MQKGIENFMAENCQNDFATKIWRTAVHEAGHVCCARHLNLEVSGSTVVEGPSYSGVLSTASGLVFAGDHDGTLMAVNAETGRVLWQYRMGGPFWGKKEAAE